MVADIACVCSVTGRYALDDGHNSMAAVVVVEPSRIRRVATLSGVMARVRGRSDGRNTACGAIRTHLHVKRTRRDCTPAAFRMQSARTSPLTAHIRTRNFSVRRRRFHDAQRAFPRLLPPLFCEPGSALVYTIHANAAYRFRLRYRSDPTRQPK